MGWRNERANVMPGREVRPPTLPALPSFGGEDRSALIGGLTFVEGAQQWGERDLVSWFEDYFVAPKRMPAPVAVSDAVIGTIAIGGVNSASPDSGKWLRESGPRSARAAELPKLLAMARSRVVITLRGFISSPVDDRFLQAAIFAERVRRNPGKKASWIAQPKPADLLSNIVLSLFCADVLMNREFYEQKLCVCDICGRVSFAPELTTRVGCTDHPPNTEGQSGFQKRRS